MPRLSATVDYALWAVWYDAVHLFASPEEAPFYVDLAKRSGGPVLEIGVGTGRVAVPIVRAGMSVVGVDLHPAMLAKVRAKIGPAGLDPNGFQLIEADMRTLDLGRTFPLVILPGRTLCSAVQNLRGQRLALARAAAHVAPNGTLALNVYNPDPALLASSSEPFLVGERTDPGTGIRYRLWSEDQFNSGTQRGRGVQTIEALNARGQVSDRAVLRVQTRYFYPSELMQMVMAVGLRVVEVYGDFDQTQFREDSPEIIVVAKRTG